MIINLIEFAKHKREVEMKLNEDSWNVIVHLGKLYLFSECGHGCYNDHWVKEIRGFLCRVSRLKNNKFPKYETILKNIWCETDRENIKGFLYFASDEEDELVSNKDIEDKNVVNKFYNICDSYLKWLAKELSEKGYVRVLEVKEELIKLGVIEE